VRLSRPLYVDELVASSGPVIPPPSPRGLPTGIPLHPKSNSMVRCGSAELVSVTLSTEPMVMPFSRTGVCRLCRKRRPCKRAASRCAGTVLRAGEQENQQRQNHERGQPDHSDFNCDHRTWCCDPAWSIPAASQLRNVGISRLFQLILAAFKDHRPSRSTMKWSAWPPAGPSGRPERFDTPLFEL